jgi:hypothetical protein
MENKASSSSSDRLVQPAASNVTIPGPILKQTSSNSSNTSPRSPRDNKKESNSAPQAQQNISFADEHGESLVENHFVQNLHYSDDATQRQNPIPACCTIS